MPEQNTDPTTEQTAPAAEPTPETPPATDAPQSGADAPQSDDQGGAEKAGPEPGNPAAKEAARYRRALRAAETERDQLREQVAAHQHQQAEQIAAERLQHAGDLWLAGVGVADLLGEDGEIDRSKVDAAIKRVLADRPHIAKPRPNFDAGVRTRRPVAPSFGQALKDR